MWSIQAVQISRVATDLSGSCGASLAAVAQSHSGGNAWWERLVAMLGDAQRHGDWFVKTYTQSARQSLLAVLWVVCSWSRSLQCMVHPHVTNLDANAWYRCSVAVLGGSGTVTLGCALGGMHVTSALAVLGAS